MCINGCPARDPKEGRCPNGHADPRECLGDHGCECLGEKELRQAILAKRQPKIMSPEEEARFRAIAKTTGLPCGNTAKV